MPLQNAYPNPTPGQEHQKICGRVDPQDFRFLKRLVPYTFGISDIVVSQLFKKFIDELRKLDRDTPFGPTLHVGDGNYLAVERILDQCNFFGGHSGQESRPDGERGADGIRETMRASAEQRPDETRSVKGRNGKGKKTKGTKEG